MNDHEIERIAMAMNALRPDWPVASLRTLLKKPQLTDRPRRDVTVALAWVACESGTATPARVLESGPWWKAAATDGAARGFQPLEPNERCGICAKSAAACAAAPRFADDDHTFEPDFKTRNGSAVPELRDIKAKAMSVPSETNDQENTDDRAS